MKQINTDTFGFKVYPLAHSLLPQDFLAKQVLVAVKYPKHMDMFEDGIDAGLASEPILFKIPEKMYFSTDRRDIYNLVEYDEVVRGYFLNPEGQALLLKGYKGFCFIDHLNRPVEYLIPNFSDYVKHTSPINTPVCDRELIEAIATLENLEEVAKMYLVDKQSVIGRIKVINQAKPVKPVLPPVDYLEKLFDAIDKRELDPTIAAAFIGITVKQLKNIYTGT